MDTRKLFLCSLAGLAALAPVIASAQDIGSPKWSPWFELGGFYGSNDTSRGEAVLWVPFAQSHTALLFGEARGKLFEDEMREGNFAIGYRQMMSDGWNFGAWGGYDIRESQHGTTFHQIAGGIEALSDRWDFRANAYLPLDDSETVFTATALNRSQVAELSGNQIGLVTRVTSTTTTIEDVALWGFDAEIGAKLFASLEDVPGPRHELRVYAGAFHFDHSDLPNSVTGPRARAEWRMDDIIDQWEGSRLTFEAEYSHDNLRDDRVEIGARLRLPFGVAGRTPTRLSAQERRMSEGLERDTDIVTDTHRSQTTTQSSSTEKVEDATTSVRFDRVATVDGTGDLSATSTTAGANSLIIADGSSGDFNGAQILQGDQTLMGGGSTIQVRGVDTGAVVDFQAPGARPTLLNTANSSVLTIGGSNIRVTGVDIEGSSAAGSDNFGIFGGSWRSNIVIDRVAINSTGDLGIGFYSSNSVSLSDVTVTDAGGHGIYFANDNIVTISNTTVERSIGSAFVFVDDNVVTMTDSAAIDSTLNGVVLYTRNDVTASRVTIDTATNGFILGLDDNKLTLNESVLAGQFQRGIRLAGSRQELSGTGNTVRSASFNDVFCSNLGAGHTGQLAFDYGNCP